jgi:hypothetical protein
MARLEGLHTFCASLGKRQVLIEDEEFMRGFNIGYDTFHAHHTQDDEMIGTTTLLFLLKNGWNAGMSDQWTTGYIMGWLAAFYEQEDGQLTPCIPAAQRHGAGIV